MFKKSFTGATLAIISLSLVLGPVAPVFAQVAPPAGLVASYSFYEGTGTITADQSGNSITGTLMNGPVWTVGKNGGGLSFDGVNDYVNLGSPAGLQMTGSMTVSAWVYETGNVADDGDIVSKSHWQFKSSPDTGVRTYAITITNSAGAWVQRYSNTVRALNTWYYVTGVYNAAAQTLDIYVNGALDNGALSGTVLSVQQNGADLVNIGRRPSGGFNIQGTIDDVRIYNRALSGSEIAADMATPVGGTFVPDTTAPAISAIAASGITQSGATISWTTNEGATTQVDYGLTAAYGSQTTLDSSPTTGHSAIISGLASSTAYHYRVRSSDAAGNEAISGDNILTTVTADTQAPSIPAGLTATSISSSQINLSWAASTDNVGVAGYRVYRGGTQIATSTTNSYANTGLTASTTYTYTVAAYDAAGNASAQSASASATTPSSIPSGDLIPADRATTWNPGLNAVGGIPNRTTICATLSPRGGTLDDATAIQTAIDACPVGQVVQLSAGTFRITNGPVVLNKGVTLRGQSPAQTRLVATTGLVVAIGGPYYSYGQSVNLATNVVKGSYTVTLASNPGLSVGEVVLIDQLTDPAITTWGAHCPLNDDCRTWRTRVNRPLTQLMEVASVSGNTVTFVTPFHIGFSTSYGAQLTRFPAGTLVKYAGVEDLYIRGGTSGNIRMIYAAYSWIKGVESDFHIDHSVDLIKAYRSVVRDSYVHSAQNPTPGGGAYGIAISEASSDNLIENNIVWNMNKVMVMEASGGGNVIAYNYMEDGWINGTPAWVETGLNAAHMATGHYELFEGNQSFNMDSDNTWGNAIYITGFRNHLTGARRSISPVNATNVDARRAIGVMEGHWWYTIIGNVLGTPTQSAAPYSGFTYEWSSPSQNVDNPVPMWRLGWDPENAGTVDNKVLTTLIRGGNFDYFTNTVRWENVSQQAIPSSLYLSSKPSFFGSYTWPWVDATGGTKTYTLPARARFDAGTPFAPPPGGGGGGDTTAPTVSISAPATGATVSSTITVSATASDNVGVAGVQFKLDGANLGAEDTSSPYGISWNTASSTNASHALSAVARDAAGNAGTATNVTVTTSNTQTLSLAIVPSPTSGAAPLTVSLTATVSGTAQGSMNYTLYCNRSDTGTNVTTPYDGKLDGTTTNPYTAANLCAYST